MRDSRGRVRWRAPKPVRVGGVRALEVRLLWGDTVVAVRRFAPSRVVVMGGDPASCDMVVPLAGNAVCAVARARADGTAELRPESGPCRTLVRAGAAPEPLEAPAPPGGEGGAVLVPEGAVARIDCAPNASQPYRGGATSLATVAIEVQVVHAEGIAGSFRLPGARACFAAVASVVVHAAAFALASFFTFSLSPPGEPRPVDERQLARVLARSEEEDEADDSQGIVESAHTNTREPAGAPPRPAREPWRRWSDVTAPFGLPPGGMWDPRPGPDGEPDRADCGWSAATFAVPVPELRGVGDGSSARGTDAGEPIHPSAFRRSSS